MATILIMVGIFALIWFLMLRPQRKKMQAQQQLLQNLEVGDDILTAAGIYGRISSFDDDSLYLEVSDNSFIKITRDSIAQKISYEYPNESNGTEGKNLGSKSQDEETEAEEASDQENN